MLYIEDYGIPIPQHLKNYNYVPPIFCLHANEHMTIKKEGNEFVLRLNGKRNMGYKIDHSTALTFISHYELAYGHVIVTGLGLSVIATWVANKKEVTKVTVIENNIHLIDYFKTYGKLSDKIELVYADATTYTGKCDVLLCNHAVGSSYFKLENNDWPSILNNIECDVFYNFRVPKIAKTYENYLTIRKTIPQLPYFTEEKFISYA